MVKHALHIILFVFLLVKCSQPNGKNEPSPPEQPGKHLAKPGANNNDTLFIREACVVFYQPDSLQIEKIRQITEPAVFESSMHEFFYQQRNAHLFLKEHWPKLKTVDVGNKRFLLFIKQDKSSELVDLNTRNDSHGMFAFDGKRSPKQLEMMNVESEIPGYFSR